jgi:putative NADH-flavin reductase
LVKEGAEVTSISLDENNFEAVWNVYYINADLRDINNCFEAVKGQDYVFFYEGVRPGTAESMEKLSKLL